MKNVLGIICGVLTVAAFILTFQIFNAWWLAVLILIIGVPVALIHEKIEKYQKTCSKCKTPYDFNTDIEYHSVGGQYSSDQNSTTYKERVEFNCICHNCGETKTYTKQFVAGRVSNNGRIDKTDVNIQIQKFFQKEKAKKTPTWVLVAIAVFLGIWTAAAIALIIIL